MLFAMYLGTARIKKNRRALRWFCLLLSAQFPLLFVHKLCPSAFLGARFGFVYPFLGFALSDFRE